MKRIGKAIIACACVAALAVTGACGFAGCSSSSEVKIGVLVADVSGDEAVAFQSYYKDYIEKQYDDVTFTYTSALSSAEDEKSAIEQFAGQGYDAIISLSSSDRASQMETCAKYSMYYAIASGMDDDIYDTYKSNEYFVGQIGPSMDTEYEAGLAMGEYFKDSITSSVGIYGAFIPNPMHVYRLAGLLTGLGATYDGKSGYDIVSAIYANSDVDSSKIELTGKTVYYMEGFSDDTFSTLYTIIGNSPQAYLSVGMATTFFADSLNTANIPYSDIDSFTSANGELMNTGTLTYLAGKYASSIGPIFAAVYNAVKGNRITDEDGNAISIGQGYWVATSYEQFQLFQSADSATNPIFTKDLLDTVIGSNVTYSQFKTFVETDRTPSSN